DRRVELVDRVARAVAVDHDVGEVDRVEHRTLLDLGQQVRRRRPLVPGPLEVVTAGERVDGRDVVVDGQADLLQVVDALHPAGGLACGLHGGQQQPDQDGDDGDDDQELDQRETAAATAAQGQRRHDE